MANKAPSSSTLVPRSPGRLARIGLPGFSPVITNAGEQASRRFLEFFTAHIRNKNTRAAYAHAVTRFFDWCETRGFTLEAIQPVHVAAYIETHPSSKPTVKQHLAAIRQLFDWLVVGQVVPVNPAAPVRGPRTKVKRGKTPLLPTEETRELLDSIDTSHVVGLRDRALIAAMVYTFARVSAVITMKVEDFFPKGRRWWLRLDEKGGKHHEMPAHHNLEAYVDAYLDAAGIRDAKKTPLFRSARGKTKTLTENPMARGDVYRMIRRRARDAGIETPIGCHSFRATGITAYLKNGGRLELAQQMAGHESARTTGLYDRRDEEITLDEVERITI